MGLLVLDRFDRQKELVPQDRLLREWVTVIGLALILAVSEEITKFFLRRSEV